MKFHKDAATSLHQENHETILCLVDSNLTNHCSGNAETIKVDNKDDGGRNYHSRNKKWRDGSEEGGDGGGYSEVFLNWMNDDESKVFNPFQKNALLRFGINSFHEANDLYRASFRAAIYMGDMQLFSQGLQTIADILMCVEDGVEQSKMTIHGLSSLIKSAEELLKANEISEDEHAMLLAATFSRQASMKLMFTMFHSPLFHNLVTENGENTKIGKGIIFHCICDLDLLCKSMELLTRLGGSRRDVSMLDQALNIFRDCKDTKECGLGSVQEASLDSTSLMNPSVAEVFARHGTSLVAQGSNSVNGIEVRTWLPVESYLMDGCGREFIFHQGSNVIDIGSGEAASSCISKRNEDIVKQEHDERGYLSIGQLINLDKEKEFKGMLSEMYCLKGVCMNHLACVFLRVYEKVYNWLQLLFEYSSKSGSNKKSYKAVKGSIELRLWHRAVCFAILLLCGFQEALASEERHQPSKSDVDAGTGHVPLTEKAANHEESSSLRHRSITGKADDWVHDQEDEGNEMRDLSVATFSNKTGLTSDEYIELNFTSTANTSMSSLNIFDAIAGSLVGKGEVPKFIPKESVNTKTKLSTQLKMVAQVGMDIVGAKSSDSSASPKRSGVLTHSDFGGGFDKVSKLTFDDLGSTGKKGKKSLIFKRMNINVPLPQFWKMDENGTLSGEVAQVWYGQGQNGSAMFVANKDGGIIGSLHDGKDSYSFQTGHDIYAPIGNMTAQAGSGATQPIKYTVNQLNPVVAADFMDSMTTMIVGADNTANVTEESRNTRRLQANCDDVEGYYGTWRDTRGHTCATYTRDRRYCSFTGANYGLTPQQACCACGGGVILIDVLIVDDTSKGRVEVLNVVNLSIFQTNLALSNSGTRARLRLVQVYKTIRPGLYNTGNNDAVLNSFSKDNNVITMRDAIGADLVHLFEDYLDTGYANLGGGTDSNAVYGFIFFGRATLAGTYLYAHEAGHSLGCNHDRETVKWESPNHDFTGKYNYGYRDTDRCFEDLMSYPPGSSPWYCYGQVPRVLQYSNIKNKHYSCGTRSCYEYPIGTAESNCGRAIDENAPRIANYRKFVTGWFSTVKLCKHPGCMGGSYHASPSVGDWNDMPADLGQDQVTEINIPRGLYIEFFEHGSFTGWGEFEGSPDFDRLVTLTGRLNDSMSSFRVRSIPSGKVRLCKHDPCTWESFYASVGKWSSMPWEIGNDQLTTMYVPKGFKIEIFEHSNFVGWSRLCTAATRDVLCSLANTSWNDQASSFKISLAL